MPTRADALDAHPSSTWIAERPFVHTAKSLSHLRSASADLSPSQQHDGRSRDRGAIKRCRRLQPAAGHRPRYSASPLAIKVCELDQANGLCAGIDDLHRQQREDRRQGIAKNKAPRRVSKRSIGTPTCPSTAACTSLDRRVRAPQDRPPVQTEETRNARNADFWPLCRNPL